MKKLSRPQYHRIRRILELIRRGTRQNAYPSARDLAQELEVSWSTVIRDLDFLRDDEEAPIEYDASRKGFCLTDDTWNLPPVTLSAKEVFAFSVGKKTMEAFAGTPLDVGMRSVLRKISDSLQGNVTVDIDSLTDRMTVLREDYVIQDMEIWGGVVGCVQRRELMQMQYQKFNGEVKRYSLAPYHLLFYHGNWYVVGGRMQDPGRKMHATGSEGAVMFAVSRIREIERTREFFEVPAWFDAAQYIRESFGIVHGGKVFKVRLLFSKKIATYIKERQWHPTQKVVNKRDGSIELSLETAGWKELVRWILSWQPDVKVISPKRLRDRIEEKMRQALSGAEFPCGK